MFYCGADHLDILRGVSHISCYFFLTSFDVHFNYALKFDETKKCIGKKFHF